MSEPSEELPFLSVCVPARNAARELPHTLANLGRSDYPAARFEVLIGDHGSSDGTAEVVARHATSFASLRRVHVSYESPNRARVRNALIREARGSILVFIDHDVLVSRNFLASHARAHARFPHALVAGVTFGKGFFRKEIDELVSSLDLEDIESARELLHSRAELADARFGPGMLNASGQPVAEVSQQVAAFRFFWTCNTSARRSDIDACGGFDEAYVGWGVEDDDFAQQFRSQGKQMVFSREAWAFHIPHRASTLENLGAWRRNFEHFSRKFHTREIEYYALHMTNVVGGSQRMEGMLGLIKLAGVANVARDAAALVPERPPRRLCHFLGDRELAEQLGVTDALDPFGALTAGPRREGPVQFWPFFGLKTPFQDRELEESLVLVDLLAVLDPHTISLALLELARVSRRVVFCCGSFATNPAFIAAVNKVREVAELVRFAAVEWRARTA